MAGVEFRHCHKVCPLQARGTTTEALKGIDLTVADGEFLVLGGGPSGCGKTTLLPLLAGLESLSGGDVLVRAGLCNTAPGLAQCGHGVSKEAYITTVPKLIAQSQIRLKLIHQTQSTKKPMIHKFFLKIFNTSKPSH